MTIKGFPGLEDEAYVYDSLILNGFFSDKLPPVFACNSFLAFLHKTPQWAINRKTMGAVNFSIINNKQSTRTYTIPHPYSYAHLCYTLRTNWKTINEHVHSKWKNFCPNVLSAKKLDKENLIFEMTYPAHINGEGRLKPEELFFGSKYLADADISNFFPSIYSHSVSWAVAGRENAYTTRNDNSKWYNKLDAAIRSTNNNESVGLPVGPHTSNIISDIILSCIDSNLNDAGYKFIRYIDDYKCYAPTKDVAELFIADLTSELSKFKLSLNRRKTKIHQQPMPLSPAWKTILAAHQFRESTDGVAEFNDSSSNKIINFLDTAVSLYKEEEDPAILRYAIRRLARSNFTDSAFSTFENYTLQLIFLYPHISNCLIDIYRSRIFLCSDTHKNMHSALDSALQSKSYGAASFIMYTITSNYCTGEISKSTISNILASNDCILILMLTIYMTNIKSSIDEIYDFTNHIMTSGRTDEFWILIYEMYTKKHISKIIEYPHYQTFVDLKKHNVTFLAPNLSIQELK